jgi:hypothetical protein
MSARARGGKLDPCPATSSSTATSRSSAASSSPRSKRSGGHAIWWNVEATSEEEALRLLQPYVAERTTVARVSQVEIR